MHPDTQQVEMSKTQLWSARVMSALVVSFLLFDSALHLASGRGGLRGARLSPQRFSEYRNY